MTSLFDWAILGLWIRRLGVQIPSLTPTRFPLISPCFLRLILTQGVLLLFNFDAVVSALFNRFWRKFGTKSLYILAWSNEGVQRAKNQAPATFVNAASAQEPRACNFALVVMKYSRIEARLHYDESAGNLPE